MKVRLKRGWFVGQGEHGRRVRRTPPGQVTDLPDELFDSLPRDAEVVEGPRRVEVNVAPPSRVGEEVQAPDPEDDPATAFKRQLEAEGREAQHGPVGETSAAHAAQSAQAVREQQKRKK